MEVSVDKTIYYSLGGEKWVALTVMASLTSLDTSASDELSVNSDFVLCCISTSSPC